MIANHFTRRFLTLALAASFAVPLLAAQNDDYKLVWSDDFDGSELNTKAWNVEVNGNGGGNQELQYYTAQNVKVANGNLVITAKKQSFGGKSFTSGRINTMGKVAFEHGKVEARIKLPKTANGLWPAFWLMGNDMTDGISWPYCGEIDVLEAGGQQSITSGTQDRHYGAAMHWGPYINGQHPMYSEGVTAPYSVQDEAYHLFTMVWDEQKVSMYLDQDKYPEVKPYFTMNVSDTAQQNSAGRYFHKRFFLLFNVAVGGSVTGIYDPSGITALSDSARTMQIDWVRIYQKNDALNYQTPDGSEGTDSSLKPSADNDTKLGRYGKLSLDENGNSTFDFENSSDYVLIGTSKGFNDQIQGKIKADYNVDNVSNFLYVWENTYKADTSAHGVNSFGFEEAYPAFTVGNVGWSGLGYASTGKGKDLSMLDDSYILHFAMRGTDKLVHTNQGIYVGNSGFTIGSAAFGDNGKTLPTLGDYKRDGRWCSFDIPVSVLRNLASPLFADSANFLGNVFAVLSGGTSGAKLQFDNVFFYKNPKVDTTIPTVDDVTEIGPYASKSLDANGKSTFNFDDGYDYVLISTSKGFNDQIQGKVKADYNVDDVNNFLWIWENTYTALTSTGVNSFGFDEPYPSFKVGTVGWSGLGFASQGKGKDLSMLDGSYYLHFSMKGTDLIRHNNHTIGVGAAQFVIGNSTAGAVMLGDYKRDGEWYSFDIPFSEISAIAGNPFTKDGGQSAYIGNVFFALSGGTTGTELQFDNIFFYKKHSKDSTNTDVDPVLGRYGSKSLDADGKPTFDLSANHDYVLITLGEKETAKIKNQTLADYRPDDVNHFLYVWENTYSADTTTQGANSFGENEGYNSFKVGYMGWSGLGFASTGGNGSGKDLTMLDDDYYLHMAFKGVDSTAHVTHAVGVGAAHFSVGQTAFVDNGNTYGIIGDFNRDGQWYSLDIPFSEIKKRANPVFDVPGAYTGNVISMLSGAKSGVVLTFDAIFFYKKGAANALAGDINGDGKVNVSDVTELVNQALNVTTPNPKVSDLNGDGLINVSDVTKLVNIISSTEK